MADIFRKLKRKSTKSNSTSSEEDNRPSEGKRSKFDLSEEDCGIDEVHSVLEMAEDVLPKLGIVLKKLEAVETKLENLKSMSDVDAKVNALTTKVETLLLYMGFRATLNFRKFKVALNSMYRIFLNFAKSCVLSCLSKVDNKKKKNSPWRF